jgi:hypothetical protein
VATDKSRRRRQGKDVGDYGDEEATRLNNPGRRSALLNNPTATNPTPEKLRSSP